MEIASDICMYFKYIFSYTNKQFHMQTISKEDKTTN